MQLQVGKSSTSQLNATRVGSGSKGQLKQLNAGSMQHKSAESSGKLQK
jgi:hypothetical protein